MMPDNNPFLEGYVSAITCKAEPCPYDEGTGEYARWCRGFGGKPPVKAAAKVETSDRSNCRFAISAEGRRPFVEGYKSAILAIRFSQNTVCPYELGTPEHARWWKGFREPIVAGRAAPAKKPATVPVLEGRRPFVEGYKSQILAIRFGKKSDCPYEEGTTEYERWNGGFTKGDRAPIASKARVDHAAHW